MTEEPSPISPGEPLCDFSPNPLLKAGGLPPFAEIKPEHVKSAICQLLADSRKLIARLSERKTPPDWGNFVQPLSDGLERLSWAWGIVGHLHFVNDIPEWRDAYNAMLPEVTRFYSELGQEPSIFAQYKSIAASAGFSGFSAARRRLLENALRDFRLSGADLPEEGQCRFREIQEELADLSARFSENLLDATNAFSEMIENPELLEGLPEDRIEAARLAAESAGEKGWKLTLHMPSYFPVMQYAKNRALRSRMYRAYATRASEISDSGSIAKWDNSALMARMLCLSQEEAILLGYRNYAELSLSTKMAESPRQVLEFLRDMAARARPFAQKDMRELREFAAQCLGIPDLAPWDMAYASEKLRESRYDFSEQELKEYFTEPAVLGGLFRLIEQLFGVRISPGFAQTWHEDVRFYHIEKEGGQLIGQFYIDLYARAEKRGGAWMDSAVGRKRGASGLQVPVAYLNCNFSAPLGGKPATLTHDEVITLFHETGHGLHHLLTEVDELGVSGMNGVEWDAVELPSQFLENFCWEWEVVKGMTSHVKTGKPLPKDLFDRVLLAKNFQSGMAAVRQIEFALFDMCLNSEFDPKKSNAKDILKLLDEIRREVAVLFLPEWHRFPHSFSHIFGGGYAAGYYSYKWSEVLSADAYAAFEETGNPLDPAAGRRFLKEILSVGGARPALESFHAFRGRDPKPDALLRHSGMIVN